MSKPTKLIIHHCGGTDLDPLADTSNQSFEIVNEYHREKWNFKSTLGYYLGYQYFIDKYGKVTQARLDTETGAHTIGQNDGSIGIVLAGNFDLTFPTKEQVDALRTLLVQKTAQYGIPPENILPHRHFAVKTCYGRNLPDSWARDLLLLPPIQTACVEEKKVIEEQKVKLNRFDEIIAAIANLLLPFKK